MYDELIIIENSNAFGGYAKSHKVEIVDQKDPLVQLDISKPSIEHRFKDLLNEIKGFKYKKTLAVLLSKIKKMGVLNILLFISIQQLKQ